MKKRIVYFISLCLIVSLAACGPKVSKSWAPHGDAPEKSFFGPDKNEADESRMQASQKLTLQGRDLLEEGRHDDAIQILERAMNLNPSNGRACYYMAEAFLKKMDIRQADEFNRLARLYLAADTEWNDRLELQKKKINAALRLKTGLR
jgi:Tfp pilus assembly protein PilF